jgi:hypothetical protein
MQSGSSCPSSEAHPYSRYNIPIRSVSRHKHGLIIAIGVGICLAAFTFTKPLGTFPRRSPCPAFERVSDPRLFTDPARTPGATNRRITQVSINLDNLFGELDH